MTWCPHLTQALLCADPDRPGAPTVAWCSSRPDCKLPRHMAVIRQIRQDKQAQERADSARQRTNATIKHLAAPELNSGS